MTDSAARTLVYVVEDDPMVAETIERTLDEYGFHCERFQTARAALQRMEHRTPALCLVDLGLPDRDGLDIVREIARKDLCAVMIVTGRGVLADRVLGLETGADDYIIKPFEPRELVARVRTILRRTAGSAERNTETRRLARVAGWTFDTASLALADTRGNAQQLSVAESRLLMAFLLKPNRLLSREQLAGNAERSPLDRTIDVRVSRLRKRLGDDPDDPKLIKTVYGAGYLLAAKVDWIDKPTE